MLLKRELNEWKYRLSQIGAMVASYHNKNYCILVITFCEKCLPYFVREKQCNKLIIVLSHDRLLINNIYMLMESKVIRYRDVVRYLRRIYGQKSKPWCREL